MEIYNVIVLAQDETNLTTFIKTVADHHFLSEPQLAKSGRKYSVQFGRLNISHSTFMYLIGIPGLTDTEFIWERFADNLLGFIFLIAATHESDLKAAKSSLGSIKNLGEMPYLAVITKIPEQTEPEAIKKELGLAEERFFLCQSLEKQQIKKVVASLLNQGVKVIKKRSA